MESATRFAPAGNMEIPTEQVQQWASLRIPQLQASNVTFLQRFRAELDFSASCRCDALVDVFVCQARQTTRLIGCPGTGTDSPSSLFPSLFALGAYL